MKRPTHAALWALARQCVFARDGKVCRKCKRTPEDGVIIQVHHVIPKSVWGAGRYRLENLIAVCAGCHAFKVHSVELRVAVKIHAEIVGPELMERLEMMRGTGRPVKFDPYATLLYLQAEYGNLVAVPTSAETPKP